jgi:hypothetical protein
LTSIGSSQSSAAATVPVWVPKPISRAFSPNLSLTSWPMFSSSRTWPISVWAALPIWLLCAQTTAFDSGPFASRSWHKVSNMWVSRRFQLSAEPSYMIL